MTISMDQPRDFRGEHILRLLAGRSQVWLAQQLSVTKGLISKWVNNREIPPDYQIDNMARVLKVPCEEFFLPVGDQVTPRLAYIPIRSVGLFTEFDNTISQLIDQTGTSIRYARLCHSVDRDFIPNYKHVPPELLWKNFADKLNGGVLYQRVEVFYTKERFFAALESAKHFIRTDNFQTRTYLKPPASIPIINYRAFDDRVFLIGGYERGRNVNRDEQVIVLEGREPLITFFTEYWRALWGDAIDLLDRRLETAAMVARSLEVPEDEWEDFRMLLQL